MKTEPVSASDARELLDIYAYYVNETAVSFEYEVPSLNEFEERIRNISAKYPYIKAVDDNGFIMGYAYAGCFKNRAAYDWSVETTVYVRKDMRRKGIGRMLINDLLGFIRAHGVPDTEIFVELCAMPDKIPFYEKFGFKANEAQRLRIIYRAE